MTDPGKRWPRLPRRYLAVALTIPVMGSALGVDGGAIFQIAASESLGLDARALGIAFGLGVVSVPVQIWAARMPLWRARRNLQIFLLFVAAGCWFVALLVAIADPGDRLAVTALALTVLAEINVSVLFATAWQPLVAYGLPAEARQAISSRGRAGGGVVLALVLLVFGVANDTIRVLVLASIGVVAVALAVTVGQIAAPARPARHSRHTAPADATPMRRSIPAGMKPLYVSVAFVAVGTWPLFLIYTRDVLWPDVNLGFVAAVQLGGTLLAAGSWRPTLTDVVPRALGASVTAAGATAVLAMIRTPVDGPVEGAVTLAATGIAAAATTIVFLALLELAHRQIDEHTSVKALTLYDVVASTAMQLGLLVAGFVVTLAGSSSGWPVDPYRIYLMVTAACVVGVVARLRSKGTLHEPPITS